MNEQDFVRLLRYYRHDFMNDLQIVHGYLSIGQIDKVKDKVDQIIVNSNEERKLINSEAPHFILWILQFNGLHTNIKLDYGINLEQSNIQSIDHQLVDLSRCIVEGVDKYCDINELYDINIVLTGQRENPHVSFAFSITGHFSQIDSIMDFIKRIANFSPIKLEKTENGFKCVYVFNV